MTEIFNEGRLGITALDSDFAEYAVNDELLINKRNGRLFYKNVLGEVIDIFDRYASNVSEERLNDLEEIMHTLIKRVTENGPSKMVHFRYALTAIQNEQKVFQIPLTIFNKDTDLLILNIQSSIPLESEQYNINGRDIVLTNGVKAGTKLMILIMKNVPQVNDNGLFSGNILEDGSVPYSKLTKDVRDRIENRTIAANSIMWEHLSSNVRDKIASGVDIGNIGLEQLNEDLQALIKTKELVEGAVEVEHLSQGVKDLIGSGTNTGGIFYQEEKPSTPGIFWLKPVTSGDSEVENNG